MGKGLLSKTQGNNGANHLKTPEISRLPANHNSRGQTSNSRLGKNRAPTLKRLFLQHLLQEPLNSLRLLLYMEKGPATATPWLLRQYRSCGSRRQRPARQGRLRHGTQVLERDQLNFGSQDDTPDHKSPQSQPRKAHDPYRAHALIRKPQELKPRSLKFWP